MNQVFQSWKELLPVEILWYRTRFDVSEWKDKEVILNFGAVDYKLSLYINGQEVGTHIGGNDPFSYNITQFLDGEKQLQELELSVWDPTDTGTQPRVNKHLDQGVFGTPLFRNLADSLA